MKTLVEQNSNNTNKSNIDKKIENEGYQKVTKVSLPDGTYIYEGSADICYISDQDGKTQTGYVVEIGAPNETTLQFPFFNRLRIRAFNSVPS